MLRYGNLIAKKSLTRPISTEVLLSVSVALISAASTTFAHFDKKKMETTFQESNANLLKAINQENIKFLKEIHTENLAFHNRNLEYNRARSSLDEINTLKGSLYDLLFGKNHREVSDGVAHVISYYERKAKEDKVELSSEKIKAIAQDWVKEYRAKKSNGNSIEERRKDEIYQINMTRSLSRDNFIYIYGIFESYCNRIKDSEEIIKAQNLTLPQLLSGGQARELLLRYHRFVHYIGPIDEAIGYTKNDGEIYKHLQFYETLRDCLRNDVDKNRLYDSYKKLFDKEHEIQVK